MNNRRNGLGINITSIILMMLTLIIGIVFIITCKEFAYRPIAFALVISIASITISFISILLYNNSKYKAMSIIALVFSFFISFPLNILNMWVTAADNIETEQLMEEIGKEQLIHNNTFEYGDGSIIDFDYSSGEFKWYQSLEDKENNDNYYYGSYSIYVSDNAKDYMLDNVDKYGLTEEVVDVPVEKTMEQKETVKEIIEKVPEEKNEEIQGIEKEEPMPTFTVTKQDGTLYAKSSVNVRTLPGTHGEIISSLSFNESVQQTGVCDNGWVEISYNGNTAYVSGNYLSAEKTIINYTWDPAIRNADNATDYTLSQISKYYLMVPEEIRIKYNEQGWVINVTSGHLGQMIYNENKSIKAVTVFTEKEIWVDSRKDSARAIIHEMGHFMDDQLFFRSMGSEFNNIWEEEVEIFRANHSTHINNTNTPLEYFAEFFEVMILNPDIKKSCPKTYEFVSRCVEEIGTF